MKGINTIWSNVDSDIYLENHIDLETIKNYADNAGIQDIWIHGNSILNNKIANNIIRNVSMKRISVKGELYEIDSKTQSINDDRHCRSGSIVIDRMFFGKEES